MWLQFTWPTACPMWCSMEVEMTENTCVIPGNVLLSISFLILFLSHSVSFDVWIYMASHISIFVHKASKWRLEGLGRGWNLWKNYTGEISEKIILLQSLAPKWNTSNKKKQKTKNTHTHTDPQATRQRKLEISSCNIQL